MPTKKVDFPVPDGYKLTKIRKPTARNIAIGKYMKQGLSMAEANKAYAKGAPTGGAARKPKKVMK